MKKKSKHPQWVLAYKQPKTEIRLINGTYYVYSVTSKWNPDKKRSQKITGKLLGKITKEEGFVESDKNKLRNQFTKSLKYPPAIKEFGATEFLLQHFTGQINHLKDHFKELWYEVVALSMIRLIYQSPIKNIGYFFEKSYLSEYFKDITLGEKRTSALYRKLGTLREQIVSYMKTFITEDENVLIDATNILSYSKHIGIAEVGYNSKKEFDPQINLMMMYSSKMQFPIYYRVIPGNIREVSAFKTTLDESGAENVTIIADKGFFSEDNIQH